MVIVCCFYFSFGFDCLIICVGLLIVSLCNRLLMCVIVVLRLCVCGLLIICVL